MKDLRSAEALYALIFAVCILIALFLLTGCSNKAAEPDAHPIVQGQTVAFPPGSPSAQRLAVERVEESYEHELILPGRLVWDEDRTVRVFPPFAGRVTRIVARVGD